MATVKNKYITEPASEIVEAWLIVTAQAVAFHLIQLLHHWKLHPKANQLMNF
jgi:hypothetical protein